MVLPVDFVLYGVLKTGFYHKTNGFVQIKFKVWSDKEFKALENLLRSEKYA